MGTWVVSRILMSVHWLCAIKSLYIRSKSKLYMRVGQWAQEGALRTTLATYIIIITL